MEYETWRNVAWLCKGCGALVGDRELHTKWHAEQERVAKDSYWGGMLRPLGGPPVE